MEIVPYVELADGGGEGHSSILCVCLQRQYEHLENYFCFVINLTQSQECAHLHCPCSLWVRYKAVMENATACLNSADVWNLSWLRHSDAFFSHRSLNLTQGEREREEIRLSSWIYVYCLTCSLLWAFSGSSEVSNCCLSHTIWVSDAGLSAARCSALSPVCICMN